MSFQIRYFMLFMMSVNLDIMHKYFGGSLRPISQGLGF